MVARKRFTFESLAPLVLSPATRARPRRPFLGVARTPVHPPESIETDDTHRETGSRRGPWRAPPPPPPRAERQEVRRVSRMGPWRRPPLARGVRGLVASIARDVRAWLSWRWALLRLRTEMRVVAVREWLHG